MRSSTSSGKSVKSPFLAPGRRESATVSETPGRLSIGSGRGLIGGGSVTVGFVGVLAVRCGWVLVMSPPPVWWYLGVINVMVGCVRVCVGVCVIDEVLIGEKYIMRVLRM